MIIVNIDEFEFLKGYEYLTIEDAIEMIEHREVFEKYCRIKLRQIDIQLANMEYAKDSREKEAYVAMQTIKDLIAGIGNQVQEYKLHTAEMEKEKELKVLEEKKMISQEELNRMKEVLAIKQKYKI